MHEGSSKVMSKYDLLNRHLCNELSTVCVLMNQRGLNCFFCYTFIDVNYQKSIVCKSWHGVESRRSNRKTNTTLCDKEWGREPGSRAMLTKIWNKSAKSYHWSDSGPNFRSSWFCCFWNLIFSVISNFNKSKDLWSLTCMVPFIPGSHVIAATKIIWPPSSQSVWVVSKEGREWRSTSFRSRLGQNLSDIEAGLAHSQLLVCYPSSLVNISSIRPCSGIYLDPG